MTIATIKDGQVFIRDHQFRGIINGKPTIEIIGRQFLLTISDNGTCTGAVWADFIQKGEKDDICW